MSFDSESRSELDFSLNQNSYGESAMRSTVFSILLLTVVFCGCSSGVSSDDWLKIKRGMDKDTVKLIIGDPIHEFESEDKENLYWVYMVKGQKWVVMFEGFPEIPTSYTVDTTFKVETVMEEFLKYDKKTADEDQEKSDTPLKQKPRRPFD